MMTSVVVADAVAELPASSGWSVSSWIRCRSSWSKTMVNVVASVAMVLDVVDAAAVAIADCAGVPSWRWTLSIAACCAPSVFQS